MPEMTADDLARIRRAGAVLLAFVLVAASAACGNQTAAGAPSGDSSIRVEHVQVDGQTVPCILWDAPGNGGLAMSCDWD